MKLLSPRKVVTLFQDLMAGCHQFILGTDVLPFETESFFLIQVEVKSINHARRICQDPCIVFLKFRILVLLCVR